MEYIPLEGEVANVIGGQVLTFNGTSPSLSTTTSLVVIIMFMLIGGAAFYRYVMAGVYRLEASESGIRKSNEAFKGATLGILGVFLMFLIFFTFNRDILLSDVGLGVFRNDSVTGSGGGLIGQPPNIPPVDPSAPAPPSGSIQQRIFSAANSYRGASTRNVPFTDNGRKACAYAVNEVLKMAGLSPIGNLSVVVMEGELRKGRGVHIPTNKGGPGDIVIVTGAGNHVGICMSTGCTQVLSNSSSNASFSWVSGPNFEPSYKNLQGRVYRILN